jgi:hypothetical protein
MAVRLYQRRHLLRHPRAPLGSSPLPAQHNGGRRARPGLDVPATPKHELCFLPARPPHLRPGTISSHPFLWYAPPGFAPPCDLTCPQVFLRGVCPLPSPYGGISPPPRAMTPTTHMPAQSVPPSRSFPRKMCNSISSTPFHCFCCWWIPPSLGMCPQGRPLKVARMPMHTCHCSSPEWDDTHAFPVGPPGLLLVAVSCRDHPVPCICTRAPFHVSLWGRRFEKATLVRLPGVQCSQRRTSVYCPSVSTHCFDDSARCVPWRIV